MAKPKRFRQKEIITGHKGKTRQETRIYTIMSPLLIRKKKKKRNLGV